MLLESIRYEKKKLKSSTFLLFFVLFDRAVQFTEKKKKNEISCDVSLTEFRHVHKYSFLMSLYNYIQRVLCPLKYNKTVKRPACISPIDYQKKKHYYVYDIIMLPNNI